MTDWRITLSAVLQQVIHGRQYSSRPDCYKDSNGGLRLSTVTAAYGTPTDACREQCSVGRNVPPVSHARRCRLQRQAHSTRHDQPAIFSAAGAEARKTSINNDIALATRRHGPARKWTAGQELVASDGDAERQGGVEAITVIVLVACVTRPVSAGSISQRTHHYTHFAPPCRLTAAAANRHSVPCPECFVAGSSCLLLF